MNIDGPFFLEKVEALLRLRYKSAKVESDVCPELESIALTISGAATRQQAKAARIHLQQCDLCAEAVMLLSGASGRQRHTATAWRRLKNFWTHPAPGLRFSRLSLAGLSAVAVLVVAIVFLGKGVEKSELIPKGSLYDIHLAVERGGKRFRAREMDKLQEGDKVGFFYSAPRQGYLAIVDVDADGKASVVFPTGKKYSERIEPGTEQPLPPGGIVREGRRCEWLVGVFSDSPLAVKKIVNLLSNSQRELNTCTLEARIEHARFVRVLSFRR